MVQDGVIHSPGLWASVRRLLRRVLKKFREERRFGQEKTNV